MQLHGKTPPIPGKSSFWPLHASPCRISSLVASSEDLLRVVCASTLVAPPQRPKQSAWGARFLCQSEKAPPQRNRRPPRSGGDGAGAPGPSSDTGPKTPCALTSASHGNARRRRPNILPHPACFMPPPAWMPARYVSLPQARRRERARLWCPSSSVHPGSTPCYSSVLRPTGRLAATRRPALRFLVVTLEKRGCL